MHVIRIANRILLLYNYINLASAYDSQSFDLYISSTMSDTVDGIFVCAYV